MPVRPLTPEALVDTLADLLIAAADARTGLGGGAVRVAVDGAAPAPTAELADALVAPMRAAGHAALRVRAATFLRAASLRLERGRTDPDALLEDALDTAALCREVLDPLAPGGAMTYLPSLRDPSTDLPTREPRCDAGDGAVLLVDGELLLGRGLPFDLTVHVQLSAPALARRLPDGRRWALPAYERYDREHRPAEVADVLVRWDDPRRPALVRAPGG